MVIQAKPVRGSARGIKYQQSDKERGEAAEVFRSNIMSSDPAGIFAEFKAVSDRYGRSNLENKQIEFVISPTPEESKNFSIEDWQKLTEQTLEKLKIDYTNQVAIAHLHTSTGIPHIHLKISRVSLFGEMKISSERIGEKSGKIADEIAKERGWKTAKELKSEKLNEIGRTVSRNAEKSYNLSEFVANMSKDGLIVQVSEKENKPYGIKIIPADELQKTSSKRKEIAGQGYKFSEIPTGIGKSKFKTADFIRAFEEKPQLTPLQRRAGEILQNDINQPQERAEQKPEQNPQEKDQYSRFGRAQENRQTREKEQKDRNQSQDFGFGL